MAKNAFYKISRSAVAILLTVFAGGILISSVLPNTVSADSGCNSGFLGFPAWYRGLTDGDCTIKNPNDAGGLQSFAAIIVINVVEAMMVLAAYVTAGFLIYGGFMFLTSGGSPEGSAKARKTLLDASIGLVIVLSAVAIIQFVASSIMGS